MTQNVLVVDFGAQYAQLIARRVREAHVYSEIVQCTISADEVRAKAPAAIILSGGPKSVYEVPSPSLDPAIYELGIPVLGICYGAQLMAQQMGGDVANTGIGEYGRTTMTRHGPSVLMDEWPASVTCWMSHGDAIATAPDGFVVTGSSPEGPVAVMEDVARRLHAVQFHPEVAHTERGQDLLANFLHHVALVTKAVGNQLTCVFVDTGLMRKDEGEQIEETFTRQFGVELIHVKAQDRFFDALAGVIDPEAKRKIIGELFIREFETVARDLGKGGDGPRFLVQGTLYPDVIESGSGHAANIKSHHNVGGLPEDLSFELVEPLRNLFKDEVRHVGEELGLPAEIVWRQPFPGPGLGVRIVGEVTRERAEILRHADYVVVDEIKKAGLYRELWQSFAVLPAVRTVGVMGDGRTYAYPIIIRAVTSDDAMTADWARLPYDVIEKIANRLIREVDGVNRVALDVTSKPPGTIEWE